MVTFDNRFSTLKALFLNSLCLSSPYHHFQASLVAMGRCQPTWPWRSPPRKGTRRGSSAVLSLSQSVEGSPLTHLSRHQLRVMGSLDIFPLPAKSHPLYASPRCSEEHYFPFLIDGCSPLGHILLLTFPRLQEEAALFSPRAANVTVALMACRT